MTTLTKISLDEQRIPRESETPCFLTHARKRDGRVVPFDSAKIKAALLKGGQVTGEFSEEAASWLTVRTLSILQMVTRTIPPTVEEIQDVVEEVLLSSLYKKTAKAYILYRDQHNRIREIVQKADLELVDKYLDKLDWQVKENSNMAYSLQGLNNYVSSEVTKIYWLNKIYSPEIRTAHTSGALHLHDLGLLSVYCVGWDLKDVLSNGFQGAPGKAESRPARHFRSALGQIVNFFYTLQGEAAGAQAFSNFDTLLAPFIRYDNLSFRDVKQALQEFIFNINVPTRVGFQTPFTNITLDLQPPRILAGESVVMGGELKNDTYGDFQKEMNILNTAFLEVMSEGDAKGRVFTFPIPTYNITKEFDWDNPDLNGLWEVTAKYGIPYFANFVNSEMNPDDARSMCCRLRIDLRNLDKRGGGLFGANPLTGSIGVVTINMPRIGHLAKTEADYFQQLEHLMEIGRASLETKRKVLETMTEKNLYPYTKFYLRDIKNRHGKYWSNHFSTIGLVGLNESCLNFVGEDIGSEKGLVFAKKVLDFMRGRLQIFQLETGNNYNLEATPAEGTSYRLARIDQSMFPGILFANGKNTSSLSAPFYTNSSQLPVNFSNDIFRVLDLQEELQTRYTGGTVLHVFLGESVVDPGAVKSFIKKACESYRLPYLTISPSFSVCPNHGYIRGEVAICPQCESETEIYSRVVGYLRPVDQWNEGKQAEFNLRSQFNVSKIV